MCVQCDKSDEGPAGLDCEVYRHTTSVHYTPDVDVVMVNMKINSGDRKLNRDHY